MYGKCGLFHESYAAEARFFPSTFQKVALVLFLALYCVLPLVMNAYYLSILNLIHIAVIAALGLNLLTGGCGQISLGHGAFVGVGAYAAGYFGMQGVPFLVSLPLAGLVTAAVGIFFGLPSLRLKGIYLAIATLAAQIILTFIFLHADGLTGGSMGMMVDPPTIAGYAFDSDHSMFYLTLAVAALVALGVGNIMRTKVGRSFVAVRDFYLSAEIVGVNLFSTKLTAFGVSAFIAGLAGALWAHYLMYITPEQFGIGLSISYLAMIIIGGMGSVLGSILGAVFITILPEALTLTASGLSDSMPALQDSLIAMKEGVFGMVLILFLIFEPEGLAHRWRLIQAYWKLYPFAH